MVPVKEKQTYNGLASGGRAANVRDREEKTPNRTVIQFRGMAMNL